jgi:hypothetical protein
VVLHGLVCCACALSVLIHEPHKEFKTRALLWTGLKADPDKIVACFAMRWQLQVVFLRYGGISGSRRRGSGLR